MTERGAVGRGSPEVQREWYRLQPPSDLGEFPELGEDPIESHGEGGVRWSGTCPRLVGTDRLSLPAELFREELPDQLQTLLGSGISVSVLESFSATVVLQITGASAQEALEHLHAHLKSTPVSADLRAVIEGLALGRVFHLGDSRAATG